ncbi:hypothetical protein OXB_3016 [Bacillus sp. OxB-1]|uniref:hypothetical protein n=1 Tax=Bacillus sp. (strain OxB-1) TaxID=98228 RepID=UPI000581B9FB|nr:hypothetical protein [Bacillus sp. OxB-1]BAQ11486.1 hypothetical protein OXB_3016 [Bacillus sp. OxB-1]
MPEYLWDIDIEQLPLGWSDIYEDAFENYPNGMMIEGVFFHPVDYHAQLLSYFHTYQAKAKAAYGNLQKQFDRDTLNLLVAYDKFLYSILLVWLDDERDSSQFDSSKLDKELKDSIWYNLSAESDLDFMKPFKPLQLIQMNFDAIQ